MSILRYWALLLIFTVCLPVTAHGLEIRFRESALAQGEKITLGEVAAIMPDSDENQALAAEKLYPAPEAGQEVILHASKIEEYLTSRDESLTEVRWTGSDDIKVKRASIRIDNGKIRKILTDYLARNKDLLPQADIHFKEFSAPRSFKLPQGKVDIDVIPSSPSILDSHRFTIIFRINGQVEKNIAVRARLEAIAPVAVAINDLRRGLIIQEEDINLARLDLVGLKNPCFDLEELVGKKMKRSVRRGQPIDRRAVEFPPMIRRGELVTITAHKGPLTVTAKGIARHDAKQGEIIKVINSNSQKVIICKVSAPGHVKVEL